jgi:hypothetical protein
MILEIGRVANRILELAKNLSTIPPETEEEERAEVEPVEPPIVKEGVALEPQRGSLCSALETLQDRTVWAVDGGALTIDLPIGRLIIGRAVIIKMKFHGYETVKCELIVPALPFFVCGGPANKGVPEAVALYLIEAIRLIPEEIQKRQIESHIIDYFSDGEAYLDKFRDSWSGATQNQLRVARAIDIARNAAETIAFQTALRLAKSGDLVLRDGRLHGSVGFWTSLCKIPSDSDEHSSQPLPEAVDALRSFIEDVKNAARSDVRVVGIIKRPVADECCKWFRSAGIQIPRYSTDAILYLRTCEELLPPEPRFGKRSTLWRYKPYQHQEDEISPRRLLEEFRRSITFYYLIAGLGTAPFRVDMPTYGNMYHTWYKEVADQIYTLARGSGSPSRIPHPIKIADAYARVRRAEASRFLYALIAEYEGSGDSEAKALAKELRAWMHRGR